MTVATVLMVTCAVVLTALFVRREFLTSERGSSEQVAAWRELGTNGNATGPADAPITIVQFSDFQCPACAALQPDLAYLVAMFPERVRVVYRHLPLTSIHPYAQIAAEASECAAAQGRFAVFHDLLFAKQDSIGLIPMRQFGIRAGTPDIDAFEQCVEQNEFAWRILEDRQAAATIHARGTPTILVNEIIVRGRPSVDSLVRLVQR